MRTVDITNIYIKVWIRKSEFPQGNLPRSLTQPRNTIQRPFEIMDIKYDRINVEIVRIECVECNTSIGINVMKVDDIGDFINF